jgi:hypothetical protein
MAIEKDPAAFPAYAYKVKGWSGIAFWILGWETEPTEETEWSGMEDRTGNVIGIMVGDDRKHSIDPDDLTPLDEEGFCHGCGQIGCNCYR